MKRRPPIVLILLLLVAGAIVNVAVAWTHCVCFDQEWTMYGLKSESVNDFKSVTWHVGLPLRSLTGHREDSYRKPVAYDGIWVIETPVFTRVKTDEMWLVYHPVWPGFAINTVFYAVILWGLFATPFALRRRRRIKRGLCPKCAYPVGTNAVCTECGAAVPRKVETSTPQSPNVQSLNS